MRKLSLCLLLFTLAVLTSFAQDKTSDKKDKKAVAATTAESAVKALESQFKFQQGKITLADNLATLNVPPSFRYLDGSQASKVLTDLWGNPPSEANNLGMLFPANANLVGENSWGVVITYEEDGYVEDKEAENINYDELLKQMREGEQEANAERQKAGYEAVRLLGWAAPPRYDKAAHKLYWAKELQFGKDDEHTLNYDIRVLGRKGVLSLNAVASIGQLKEVEQGMQGVLQFVEFNPGSRYSDYQAGIDKLAAYGIGALIAGKVAAKAGFFKLLLGALIAGKKFVIIGLIALGVLLKKLFSGRSQASNDPA
jgi:uncharacterized membrane-anchored protein